MTTKAMSEPTPLLPSSDVLGPDTPYHSSDDEPLVPVREKVKPVKRERSATATVEPDTKKAMHVKRERKTSAEPEPGTKKAMHVERERSASALAEPETPTVDNDTLKDPRLVAKQAKFTLEKANLTITRVDDQVNDSGSDDNSYADVEESQAV
jgi:hypothetical protein